MVIIKSPEDLEILREGGKISKQILDFALKNALPGVVLKDLDNKIGQYMKEKGVVSWFPEVEDYKYNTCISVNDIWLHGIPSTQALKEGDVVKIDIGIKYKDRYLDNCWTVVVNKDNENKEDIRSTYSGAGDKVEDFLKAGERALFNAIDKAVIGKRTGDISAAMQSSVEDSGYSVITEYAGHGVGVSFHEDPQILCYGTPGAGQLLKKGMVLAIEIMYAMGNSEIKTAEDGWSIATKDGSISGMFEHTVAITENGPEILTN